MQFYLHGSITFVIISTLSIILSGQQFNMQRRTALLPYWSPRLRPIFNIYQPQEDDSSMHKYRDELQRHLLDKQRFLFASTITNPFFKIVTFTIVSSLNITSIQSCIPTFLFVAGSSNVICRRKKRGIDSSGAPEDHFQFPVYPSKPLELTTTDIASMEQLTEDLQLSTIIASSKDEVAPNEISLEQEHPRKSKRFLKYFGSTSVYSYVLVTVMTTRTISPIVAGQQLLCRPSRYFIC